jgi:hypothetical protein
VARKTEATPRAFNAVATLLHRYAKPLCDKTFDSKTGAWALAGERRQRTPLAFDCGTVGVVRNLRQRAELLIEPRACGLQTCLEGTSRISPKTKVMRKRPPGLAHDRLEFLWGLSCSEHFHEPTQQRNVRATITAQPQL